MIHKSYGRDLGPASTLFQVVCSSTWGMYVYVCMYVVCSSTWGIYFFVSRSHPMGLNALQVTSPTYSNVAILPMVTKPR